MAFLEKSIVEEYVYGNRQNCGPTRAAFFARSGQMSTNGMYSPGEEKVKRVFKWVKNVVG